MYIQIKMTDEYKKKSRSVIGNVLHCDFCGSNSVQSKDMNIINHVAEDRIDYQPKLEVNEKCEQCSDNLSNSFERRMFICNDCKDIVFIPLKKTSLIDTVVR